MSTAKWQNIAGSKNFFIFIHINKHMDGARDIFWIKSLNGTFLALQIKAFGPKFF